MQNVYVALLNPVANIVQFTNYHKKGEEQKGSHNNKSKIRNTIRHRLSSENPKSSQSNVGCAQESNTKKKDWHTFVWLNHFDLPKDVG